MDYYHHKKRARQPKDFYLFTDVPRYPPHYDYPVITVLSEYVGGITFKVKLTKKQIDAYYKNDNHKMVFCVDGGSCECIGLFK